MLAEVSLFSFADQLELFFAFERVPTICNRVPVVENQDKLLVNQLGVDQNLEFMHNLGHG